LWTLLGLHVGISNTCIDRLHVGERGQTRILALCDGLAGGAEHANGGCLARPHS